MKTQLFPHNIEAYGKITAELEKSQRTCIIHPTGTGKSFLIAAVSEAYKNVLILGPNVYVLNQVKGVLSWRKKGIEYMTYASLMYQENKPVGFDLICLDEFHRIGAPEWGNAVMELLEVNPQAKVFGTTATNVRYLDSERDMARELFDGNIASHITIAEAWSRGILPTPRYVSGLFRWDKTIADASERIKKSRRLTKEEKRERIFRLSNARLNWDLSYGMPAILRKHLDRDARRIIVFCSNIETLEQMRRKVEVWFREAGFVVDSSCIMHSSMTEVEQREQMEQFESEEGEGVKLMFSINMLNEGIHVPKVAAVIMLRTTSSRIIYLQQMGRCLTAANTDNPLVLDMVDNITTTMVVNDISIEYNDIEREQAEKNHRKPRTFEVIDYTLGVRDLISKLVPEEYSLISDEERLEIVTAFCEEHGRFPSRNDKDHQTYCHYVTLRKNLKGDPRLAALDEKYCEYKDFDKRLTMLVAFVERNGRTPNIKENQQYNNYKRLLKINMDVNNPVMNEIIKKYCPRVHNIELVKSMILNFYAKNGRMPTKDSPDAEERSIYYKYASKRKDLMEDEDIKKIIKKRRVIKLNQKIAIIKDFIDKEHRRPSPKDGEIYRDWQSITTYNKDNAEVQKMIEDTNSLYKQMDAYIAPLVEFVNKEHRAPSTRNGKEEKHIYNILAHIRHKYSDHPSVSALLAKLDGYKQMEREEYISGSVDKIEAYLDQYGTLPSGAKKANRWCRELYNHLKSNYGSHPRVAKLVARTGK
ncbi:MAG: DEAD/DEAH box helicase family protein [Bacteroidales bacterium]|nr:DEAD/DEAH box helicase family protein [Bacteroidales bacterium]